MKTVSIHQPCYMPYLGVFYKIWQSDVFVYLDDAQYSNGYVFDWNRIKTPQGECRLKVPTEKHFGQQLNQVRPKYELGWREKHLKMIEMNYKRAPYFHEFYPVIRETLAKEYRSLAELNIEVMDMFIRIFSFRNPLARYHSSWFHLNSRSEARVIEIVKLMQGDVYISGTGAKDYQSEEDFTAAGIRLMYSDYQPLEYGQQWGGPFLPNMSALDYVMNEGPDVEKLFRRIKEAGHGE